MGGHGGLNILPQKRWNVYNYENREKVRLDEEAAAKEEQLKREQSRKRDAEFRLEKLRKARGLSAPQANGRSNPSLGSSDSKHINLFEGLKDFDSLKGGDEEKGKEKTVRKEGFKRQKREEETAKVISPEDEKYRLGYGIAGKGVKAPWYLLRPLDGMEPEVSGKNSGASGLAQVDSGIKKSGKKTVEELREERMKREKREKERERALMLGNNNSDGVAAKPRRFSR